jgi:hypothetical protein
VEIEADFALAFAEARRCNPNVTPHECTELQSDSPGCGCPLLVNPANSTAMAKLGALTGEYAAAGCDLNACPDAAACPPRAQISCQAASSSCSVP